MKVLIFLTSTLALGYGFTQSEYDNSLSVMKTFIGNNPNYLATAVRLAFHDSVGGSDGCIQNMASNDGLYNIIAALDTEYTDTTNNFNQKMTKGDFWMVTAIAAINKGIENANTKKFCNQNPSECQIDITFKWNRTSCSDPNLNHEFPGGKMTWTEMMNYFDDAFDLTQDETTALMGAHTLGSALKENSGYAGAWIVGETRQFDNNFYKLMDDTLAATPTNTWTADNVAKGKDAEDDDVARWEWQGFDSSGTRMAFNLNTDFELFYNMGLASNGEPDCTIGTGTSNICPASNSRTKAQAYANDNGLWITDFTAAFTKMINYRSSGQGALAALT